MDNQALKAAIAVANAAVTRAYEDLNLLLAQCQHEIKIPSARDLKHYSGSAICIICGEDFGWYCPKSPDHICYYRSESDGWTVILRNGTKVTLNEHSDPEYQTDDCCLFCGAPEERK
jgi:hypothetical protein